MNVHELIAEAERCVPDGAAAGTRHRAKGVMATEHGRHDVAVAVRIDGKGQRRHQYFCDGIRVPRHVLLRLTCIETECPQARAVRQQWHEFQHRRGSRQGRGGPRAPQAQSLVSEVEVVSAGHRCVARAARFSCFIRCPNHAHPPLWIEKTGFDVFEEGSCIGGGLETRDGKHRPRLPSIGSVRAYLVARRLEALALLDAVATASR